MRGDGNCQFRALADQLFGDQERHAECRAVCMNQLRAESEHYRVSSFYFHRRVSSLTNKVSRLFYSHTGDKTDGYLPIYLFTYLQVFVPEDWGSYVSEMSRDAAWGDHITLQAASDAYGVGMCVVSSYKDNFVIEISPRVKRSER